MKISESFIKDIIESKFPDNYQLVYDNSNLIQYLAEYMIYILDCRARNDDEFATPDELVKANLSNVPTLLYLVGWYDAAETVRNITLENISDYVDFLYDLEWKCLNFIGTFPPHTIRYELFRESNTFEFDYPHGTIYYTIE